MTLYDPGRRIPTEDLAAERRQSIARGVGPWDARPIPAFKPRRGGRNPTLAYYRPSGAVCHLGLASQGLAPLAIDSRPSGAHTALPRPRTFI